MKCVQFGSGGNMLHGWINTDPLYDAPYNIDVTLPLPFEDNEIDFALASHLTEHLSSGDAFRFFKELHRIIKPNGVVRISVPSIVKVWNGRDPDHIKWYGEAGFSDGTLSGAIESLMCGHGHLTVWTEELLGIALMAAGFRTYCAMSKNQSPFLELRNIDMHGNAIGEHNDLAESIFIEAVK